jgi:hypothetical protein
MTDHLQKSLESQLIVYWGAIAHELVKGEFILHNFLSIVAVPWLRRYYCRGTVERKISLSTTPCFLHKLAAQDDFLLTVCQINIKQPKLQAQGAYMISSRWKALRSGAYALFFTLRATMAG